MFVTLLFDFNIIFNNLLNISRCSLVVCAVLLFVIIRNYHFEFVVYTFLRCTQHENNNKPPTAEIIMAVKASGGFLKITEDFFLMRTEMRMIGWVKNISLR